MSLFLERKWLIEWYLFSHVSDANAAKPVITEVETHVRKKTCVCTDNNLYVYVGKYRLSAKTVILILDINIGWYFHIGASPYHTIPSCAMSYHIHTVTISVRFSSCAAGLDCD